MLHYLFRVFTRPTLLILVLVLVLTGCSYRALTEPDNPELTAPEASCNNAPEVSAPPSISQPSDSPDIDSEPGGIMLKTRIMDGAETGDLLLAGLETGSDDIYSLAIPTDCSLTIDGVEAAASSLEDGMELDILFHGKITESFPAQLDQIYTLSARSAPGGSYRDLCGFYLQVLNDLWSVDPGLNDDIAIAGLDLSNLPCELTPGEKKALSWLFGRQHGVPVIVATAEELAQQGYLTQPEDGLPYWEDGCLFSLTVHETDETYSLPTLRFDAMKWRSGLGAYCFSDCTAVWPQNGTWSTYTIGAEMIA